MIFRTLVCATLILTLGSSIALSKNDGISKGDTIPRLTLTNLKGEAHTLQKPDNHLTLIYFWASWCKPCQQTLPTYIELYRKYKNASFEGGANGFTLYAISLDKRRKAWKHAADQHRMPKRLTVSDLKGWDSKAVEQFKIGAIPSSFVVDENGVVKATNVRGKLADLLQEQKQ
jgi:thiol-disulfide isomerase/thioredoxin